VAATTILLTALVLKPIRIGQHRLVGGDLACRVQRGDRGGGRMRVGEAGQTRGQIQAGVAESLGQQRSQHQHAAYREREQHRDARIEGATRRYGRAVPRFRAAQAISRP
jgi:hypothetical protein